MRIKYFSENTLRSFSVRPKFTLVHIGIPVLLFSIIAIWYGMASGIFTFGIIHSKLIYILPFTLFIFPSLLEETFFRAVLIPNDTKDKGALKIIFYLSISTLLFVLWHPLNALTINPSAQDYFLDGRFLFIATLLGLVCGYTYIYSRSIWIPIAIHWLTVVVWVFFLGGRNLILE